MEVVLLLQSKRWYKACGSEEGCEHPQRVCVCSQPAWGSCFERTDWRREGAKHMGVNPHQERLGRQSPTVSQMAQHSQGQGEQCWGGWNHPKTTESQPRCPETGGVESSGGSVMTMVEGITPVCCSRALHCKLQVTAAGHQVAQRHWWAGFRYWVALSALLGQGSSWKAHSSTPRSAPGPRGCTSGSHPSWVNLMERALPGCWADWAFWDDLSLFSRIRDGDLEQLQSYRFALHITLM